MSVEEVFSTRIGISDTLSCDTNKEKEEIDYLMPSSLIALIWKPTR